MCLLPLYTRIRHGMVHVDEGDTGSTQVTRTAIGSGTDAPVVKGDKSVAKTVGLIGLGCAKNRVDGEVMLGLLQQAGYEVAADPEQADTIIIHTVASSAPPKRSRLTPLLNTGMAETGQTSGGHRLPGTTLCPEVCAVSCPRSMSWGPPTTAHRRGSTPCCPPQPRGCRKSRRRPVGRGLVASAVPLRCRYPAPAVDAGPLCLCEVAEGL